MSTGRLYHTEGIVIRRRDQGEADRILTLCTPSGKVAVLAKGARKVRSRKAGHIELFSRSSFVLSRVLHYWDIISQAGALLRSNGEQNPIKDYNVEYIYVTGYSQTGAYLLTYINFISPLDSAILEYGKPVYDGYLIGDGDLYAPPLNQCSQEFPDGTSPFFQKTLDVHAPALRKDESGNLKPMNRSSAFLQ